MKLQQIKNVTYEVDYTVTTSKASEEFTDIEYSYDNLQKLKKNKKVTIKAIRLLHNGRKKYYDLRDTVYSITQ